jgi:KDO2-lipid IV(A) lauroyltransferase
MGVRLALEDINFWFLVKDPKTRALTEAWYRYMDRINLKKINFSDRSEAIKGVTRVLRQSGFIMMLADEYKKNGIKVDFFGKPTYMAAGPAVISLRTGAALLPMFIIRESKSRYKIIFDKPIEFHPTGDKNKDIEDLTQMRTDLLEKYVRKYPDQWLWLHSRWGKKKKQSKLKKLKKFLIKGR